MLFCILVSFLNQYAVAKPARQFGHAVQIFLCLCYGLYKESISKEMNNDDLNLHSMTKLSGWLHYCQYAMVQLHVQ